MDKHKRSRLIAAISNASGIAQYALKAKIDDDDLPKIFENLELLRLLKPANTYNRNQQGQKTARVNRELEETQAKLQKFLNPQNSEIVAAGKWLFHALGLKGIERQEALLQRDLVHREDYNNTVTAMGSTIEEMDRLSAEARQQSTEDNSIKESKIDEHRRNSSKIKRFIIDKYGDDAWNEIVSKLDFKDFGEESDENN